jgi:hypothetical protein
VAKEDPQFTMTAPSVHDSFVCSFYHHLEDRTLTILSHYRDHDIQEPYLTTEFTNVVAHHFQHVVAPSILFDIEETDVQTILSMNKELFKNGLNYNWPFHGPRTLAEVAHRLTSESINGYQIMGSCGLDGFVLASTCSINASATPHAQSNAALDT